MPSRRDRGRAWNVYKPDQGLNLENIDNGPVLGRLLDEDSREAVTAAVRIPTGYDRQVGPIVTTLTQRTLAVTLGLHPRPDGASGFLQALLEAGDIDAAAAQRPMQAKVMGVRANTYRDGRYSSVELVLEDLPSPNYRNPPITTQLLGEMAAAVVFTGHDRAGMRIVDNLVEAATMRWEAPRIGIPLALIQGEPGRLPTQAELVPDRTLLPATVGLGVLALHTLQTGFQE